MYETIFNQKGEKRESTTSLLGADIKVVREYIEWGAGPRATQSLILGAKAHAILNGNPSVNIEDVKKMVYPVLRHRVIPSYSAEADNITIDEILSKLVENA